MKKLYIFKLTLIIILLSGIFSSAFSQQWRNNLPEKKSGELTLFDYQKAFNDYWKPYNVKDGKYVNENGEKVKAGGWKQFKRWEYYWKTRVDNTTGEFPSTTAWEVWQEYKQTLPDTKSQLGNWVSKGPANLDRQNDGALQENGTGRLNCMAFDPADNNHFWVGAPAGGVWETTTNGTSWVCLTDANPIIGVSDIALPSNYNKTTNPTIYIATGDRDAVDDPSIGILKSTDGGLTWNTTGLSFNASANTRIGRIICSPSDPNTILAATFGGIYKSADAGATWTMMQAGLFIDMELIPTTTTLIATTYGLGASAYRSTDFGNTWTKTFSGSTTLEDRCDVAVTAASTTTVYIITDYYTTNSIYAIYKSTDAGATFVKFYDGLTQTNIYGWTTADDEADGGQGWYDVAFAVSNTDANDVYVGGVNGWISTNGATSFVNCNIWDDFYGTSDEVHADHHNAYFRASDNRLFDVNDGGVYHSDNVTLGASSTWTSITDGIITGQIYDIGISQTVPGTIVAGFQDNGTKLLQSADIYSWTQVKGGDGMECAIDPTNNAVQWGTYVQLQVSQTIATWGGTESSLRDAGLAAWAGPLEADPLGGSTVYIGTDMVKVYPSAKSDSKPQFNDDFIGLSQSLDATNYLSTLDIYNDGSVKSIWTASPAGCWKSPVSSNASGTYTLISNLPGNVVTDIAIDDDDYNHVYLCFGSYNDIKVYETTDGGTNWTDISAGLPPVPTGSIAINEQNTSKHEVYVGTDAGIYVKLGTAPWQLYSNGMPFVSITDLEFYYDNITPANTLLYAATYGRGIWASDCYDPPTIDLAIAQIIAPVSEYCEPGTFTPTVTISNIGTTEITSATIEYSIDGGAPVSQNWTGSLAQGASVNVTFPAIGIVLGTHTVEYTIVTRNTLASDESAVNDTKSISYSLWNHDIPYVQDFDAFQPGGNTNNYDGGTVALSECWINETTDDIDWSVNSGLSPSGSTGPDFDHTTGTGVYLYTESSGANALKNLKVSSPSIDLTNYTASQVTFWYHMYGTNMGSLRIDLFYGGVMHQDVPVYWSSTGTTTTSISGNQGNTWFQATVNVSAADGTSDLVVTFDATTGSDYTSEMAIDDFSVTGTTGGCTPPTVQATNFSATPSLNSINTSWTRGNGDRVLVVARQGSAVNADPVSGTSYTANATFGSGTQIGTGNYVVYNGLSTSPAVNVTGLSAGTTYYFAVYEFNSADNCYNLAELTGNSTTINTPVLTTTSASSITFATASSGGNVSSINGSNLTAKGVCWNTTGTPTTSDSKTDDIAQGNGTGSFTSSLTGLSPVTTYYVRAYATNSAGTSYGNEISFTTLCDYPTLQATVFNATSTATTIDISWVRGNGNNVIVLAKSGTSVNSNPLDGVSYTANATFGSGSQIGTGNYVVFNGNGTAVTVSGLNSSTTYYFAIYEYSSANNCYLLAGLTGNATTTAVPPISWNGNSDKNWQNAANWNPASIPSLTDNVLIPAGMTNYPIINNETTTAECNNLTIEASANITIASNGKMTVNGTITNNAGISGLYIESDETGTGSLIHNSSSAIQASAELYTIVDKYYMLSSPVNSISFQAAGILSTFNSKYDETLDDYWLGITYAPTSENAWTDLLRTDNILVNTGYLVLNMGDNVLFTGNLNNSDAANSINISYTNHTGTGTANEVVYTYSDMDGWNLIGNPFTSAIDWTIVDAASANLYDAVYFYNGTGYSSYVVGTDSWDGVGTNGATQYIPAMQGFFVKGNNIAGGTLNIPANARVHNSQAYYKNIKATPENFLRLKLSADNMTDETVVRIIPEATNLFDGKFDAYKMLSVNDANPQVYTKTADSQAEYSINTINISETSNIISLPMFIKTKATSYNIKFSEFNFIQSKVYLKDNSLSTTTEIKLGDEFEIQSLPEDNGGRFELIIDKSTSDIKVNYDKFNIYPNPNRGTFYLSVNGNIKNFRIEINTITGQKIFENKYKNEGIVEIKTKNTLSGIYFLKIYFDDNTTADSKIIIE